MKPERWTTAVGFPLYDVSSMGRIRNRTGLMLRPSTNTSGYLHVGLYQSKGRVHTLVHRLVLLSFAGSPKPDQKTAHMNGNCRDNRIENLTWATARENERMKVKHGTANIGENNPRAKLTKNDVRSIRKRSSEGCGQRALSHIFGVAQSTISEIVCRTKWRSVP